ncbi:MAG: hypothetical protein ABMA26_15105 [Limisphaerales bacterium]
MADTDTILIEKPPGKVRSALDNELVELVRKYGLVALLVWQTVGGGIKDSIRDVVRDVVKQELAPVIKAQADLDKRLAALERNTP